MTWQEIINVMRVEPESKRWAQFATSSAWFWIGILLGVLLIIEFVYFYKKVTIQQENNIRKPKVVPATRAGGIIGVISLFAETSLVLVWRYTSNPANLFDDLNVTSPWQLSPDGITMLLSWLGSLGAIQMLLALTTFSGIVSLPLILLGQDMKSAEKTPSSSESSSVVVTATADQRRDEGAQPEPPIIPEPPTLNKERIELPQEPSMSPLLTPPTTSAEETAVESSSQSVEKSPLHAKKPESPEKRTQSKKTLFVLGLKSYHWEWSQGVYLDNKPWKAGEKRPIHTTRLYIDPTGKYIHTSQRRKQVRLWYQSSDRRLGGYSDPDWDGQGDVHFGVGRKNKCYVYEGEIFWVGRTQFQLVSCGSEEQEEMNVGQ